LQDCKDSTGGYVRIFLFIIFYQAAALAHQFNCELHDVATGHELANKTIISDFMYDEVYRIDWQDIHGKAVIMSDAAAGPFIVLSFHQENGQVATSQQTIRRDEISAHALKPLHIWMEPSGDLMALRCKFTFDQN
jgi:hypothetical protein